MVSGNPRFTRTPLFEQFLDSVVVEDMNIGNPVLACINCGAALCGVENDDTLLVLVHTAQVHDETCPVRLAGATASTETEEGVSDEG